LYFNIVPVGTAPAKPEIETFKFKLIDCCLMPTLANISAIYRGVNKFYY
jgi:hypothetical protein